jgi:ABC-type amino acid transport substrate-binding protein
MMTARIRGLLTFVGMAAMVATAPVPAGADLDALKERGVLRHLGVPYANFVSGAGDGMDVELMQMFARRIGVRYEYVPTDWPDAIGDLTGEKVRGGDAGVERLGQVAVRGDVIANGMTVIPWRAEVVSFGETTFPTQVWLVSRADSEVSPIEPTPSLADDIVATKSVLRGRTLLGKLDTCLDPALYDIQATGAQISLFGGSLNEIAPAILNDEAEFTLLDVPDALVALQKWPGRIKVIGPVSEEQTMAPAFRKDDRELRAEFDLFLREIKADGTFAELVTRYYPYVVDYFPDFLSR